MKTPELTVMSSENVLATLAFEGLNLTASGEDLALLNERLGIKPPDTCTAALLYPGDQVLFSGTETAEDPQKADVASVGMQDLSVFPEGVLPITIGELSERCILESFAHSLVRQAQFNRRMKVIKWGAGAVFAELGVSTVVQGAGSNWGLLGFPAAGLTLGGMWLWQRRWPNSLPMLPNLEGLESPVRITPQA